MQARRIHNFLLLVITNIITKGAWAFALIVVLHSLGTEEFGLLATLWAVGTIASAFSDFGVGQVLLREGARQRLHIRSLARSTLLINSISVIVLLPILLWLVSLTTDIPQLSNIEKLLLIFVGISTPMIDRFQNIFTVFSQLNEKFNTYTIIRSVYFISLLLAFLIVSYSSPSLLNFSLTYFFITIIATITMGVTTWSQLPIDTNIYMTKNLRNLIKVGLPFLWITVLTFAYGRIEVILISLHGDRSTSGAYHAIYQIVLLTYSLSGMLFTIIYPRLYRHKGKQNRLNEDYKGTVDWLTLLVASISPLIFVYADQILLLLGGKELLPYINILRELTLLVLLLPLSVALNFLLPMDMLKHRIISDVIGVGITIMGVLFLISHELIEHVALAAVFGYLASVFSAIFILHKKTSFVLSVIYIEMLLVFIRATIALSVIYILDMPLWLGIPTYLFVFYTILIKTKHSTTNRLLITLINNIKKNNYA